MVGPGQLQRIISSKLQLHKIAGGRHGIIRIVLKCLQFDARLLGAGKTDAALQAVHARDEHCVLARRGPFVQRMFPVSRIPTSTRACTPTGEIINDTPRRENDASQRSKLTGYHDAEK